VDVVGDVGGDDADGGDATVWPAEAATDAAGESDAAPALGATDGAAATVKVVVPWSDSWSSLEKVVQRIS
jgi:hypothetical protein